MKHVCYQEWHDTHIHAQQGLLRAATVMRILRTVHPYVLALPQRAEYKACGVSVRIRKVRGV